MVKRLIFIPTVAAVVDFMVSLRTREVEFVWSHADYFAVLLVKLFKGPDEAGGGEAVDVGFPDGGAGGKLGSREAGERVEVKVVEPSGKDLGEQSQPTEGHDQSVIHSR